MPDKWLSNLPGWLRGQQIARRRISSPRQAPRPSPINARSPIVAEPLDIAATAADLRSIARRARAMGLDVASYLIDRAADELKDTAH
jgi:hypothetical protein